MKKILVIFLFPFFGFAQDYSFTSADISGDFKNMGTATISGDVVM